LHDFIDVVVVVVAVAVAVAIAVAVASAMCRGISRLVDTYLALYQSPKVAALGDW
jgi:hypothetical protein